MYVDDDNSQNEGSGVVELRHGFVTESVSDEYDCWVVVDDIPSQLDINDPYGIVAYVKRGYPRNGYQLGSDELSEELEFAQKIENRFTDDALQLMRELYCEFEIKEQ